MVLKGASEAMEVQTEGICLRMTCAVTLPSYFDDLMVTTTAQVDGPSLDMMKKVRHMKLTSSVLNTEFSIM